jgi:hypothetical protein
VQIKETGYENISKTTKTRSEVEQEVTEGHGNDSINPADEGQVAALKAGEGKGTRSASIWVTRAKD